MTRYLLFFLTGFAHALLILLYTDLAGSDTFHHRNVGLAGAVLLFAFASWLTLFSMRAGALAGMLCLLVLLYWNLAVALETTSQDTIFDTAIAIIHLVLGVLALIALLTCLRYVFRSRLSWGAGTASPGTVLKILLAAIPVTVAAAYLLYA
jgi:hypothetical protein